MLKQFFNRILSKVRRKVCIFAELISLDIDANEGNTEIVEHFTQKTKDKGKKPRAGNERYKDNQCNTSYSAIVNARNRKTMFNINFVEERLKNADALWNREMQSARKEPR